MNKKSIIIIATLLLMLGGMAKAQVFIMPDEEYSNGRTPSVGGGLPTVPIQDVTTDQYAPLGGGVFMLGLLGGAYLLGKRRKKGDE